MPRVRRGHLVVAALAVGLATLQAASAADGLTGEVSLTIAITGRGAVTLSTGRHLACATECSHIFSVRAGSHLSVLAVPAASWKLTAWSGTCAGSGSRCVLRVRRATRLHITFVPPGGRANPFLIGHPVPLAPGWLVTINSVTLDATSELLAMLDQSGKPVNNAPPTGDQYVLVNLTAANLGATPSSDLGRWTGSLIAEGSRNAEYHPDTGCIPPGRDLGSATEVSSNQSATGNLCYEVASNDADSLLLKSYLQNHQLVWLALG